MEKFSISANFECPAARRNESERFDAFTEFENFGRQTDGLGRVVSNHAVFDRYFGFHLVLLSEKSYGGEAKRSSLGAALGVCAERSKPRIISAV